MVLGVVEGEEIIRLAAEGRVEGFSLGLERAQVHGDEGGGERGVGGSVYINGRGSRGRGTLSHNLP